MALAAIAECQGALGMSLGCWLGLGGAGCGWLCCYRAVSGWYFTRVKSALMFLAGALVGAD